MAIRFLILLLLLTACGTDAEVVGAAPEDAAVATDVAQDAVSIDVGPPVCAAAEPSTVAPTSVVFAKVEPNKQASQALMLSHAGNCLLQVSFGLQGSDSFQVTVAGQTLTIFEPLTLTLQPKQSLQLTVQFAPKDAVPHDATLHIKTANGNVDVPISANPAAPCLQVSPLTVDFSKVPLGKKAEALVKVSNCGAQDVALTAATLAGDPEFSLQASVLIACTGSGLLPSDKAPCVLPPNASQQMLVYFEGSTKTPLLAMRNASLTFVAAGNLQQKIVLLAQSTAAPCPKAVIKIDEADVVIPQTLLHANGAGSTAALGGIAKFLWTIKQPNGSLQALQPYTDATSLTLQANVVGDYEFCLEVTDQQGVVSCEKTCKKVTATPLQTEDIHVELLWDTPSDPNQYDTGAAKGADMDLHFAHQDANGNDYDCDGKGDPWFNEKFDAFWHNPKPKWGSQDPKAGDDATLDLIDADGAGPEDLNLPTAGTNTQAPNVYALGVHYFNDHKYGKSFASIRVWYKGVLTYQLLKVPMDPLSLWYVGKITWPNVLNGGSAPPMTVCYQSGDACLGNSDPKNPKGGKMWQKTGDMCITPCYVNPQILALPGDVTDQFCK